MIRSHKFRLALTASLATGVVLAFVFWGAYLYAYNDLSGDTDVDLQKAGMALTNDPKHLELDEFKESHPEMSITVYNSDGTVALQDGPIKLPNQVGHFVADSIRGFGVARQDQTVVNGMDFTKAQRHLDTLAFTLAILWLPLTLFIALVTWLVARGAFRQLEKLSEQTAAFEGSHLEKRLSITDQAEFGVFARQLNTMLDRIEQTVRREDQFASDAAHEFRTPLAIMRTRIETTLLQERSPSEYQESHRDLLAELDRLTRIVEALLRTARRIPTHVEPIDLEAAIQESMARWQDRFMEQEIFIELDSQPAEAAIAKEEFDVVIDNLLDNALRFAPDASTVRVELRSKPGKVEWSVSDEGPGIPDELGDQIFERLVRSDDSRNRASGGAGIGLAVCRKILESRHGTIEILPSEVGATIVCAIET